jgi:fatty acid desaturase
MTCMLGRKGQQLTVKMGAQQEDSSGAVTPALLTDFRAMRAEFLREGLFRSSKLFYAWKVASNYAMLAAALALLCRAQASWLAFALAAGLLATFWQQSGWLAHDFLHHQVCADRRWNKAWGYLIGNVSQASAAALSLLSC